MIYKIILFALIVNAGALFNSLFAQADIEGRQKDSLALVALYNSTNGQYWKNNKGWLTLELENWYGIEMNNEGRVIKIALYSNNLSGNLPAEIGDFTHLSELFLYNNYLEGKIPEEIGKLNLLTWLELGSNSLQDSIPYSISTLTNLTSLALNDNDLRGEIPKGISNLINLGSLYLSNNNFGGAIPEEIGELNELDHLDLTNNFFTGEVPEKLMQKENFHLEITNNEIEYIPPEKVRMFIYLDNNRLTFNSLESKKVETTTQKPFFVKQTKIYVCQGEGLTLDIKKLSKNNLGGDNNRYQWFFNNLKLQEVNTDGIYQMDHIFYYFEGTYKCVVTNTAKPDIKIESQEIIVKIHDKEAQIFTDKSNSFCKNDSLKLFTNDTIVLAKWITDDDTITSNQNYIWIKEPGQYKLSIVDSTNCLIKESEPFFAYHYPVPDRPLILKADSVLCENESIVLSSENINSNYVWLKNDSIIYGATNQQIEIEQSGKYTLKDKNAYECFSLPSHPVNVSINKLPSAPEIFTQNNDCFADSTMIYSVGNYSGYNWYLDDIFFRSTRDSFVYFYQPGICKVEVTDNFGCTSMKSEGKQIIN